jgi:ABC-type sulfate/molybdate transport systems ATPase subunit
VSRGLLAGLVAQHQERGGACILVSHHEDLLTDIPSHVLTLNKGVLTSGGTP